MRVSVMLIDDDQEMLDLLTLELKKHEVEVDIEWHEDLNPNMSFKHDIYVVDNRIFGVPKSVEIIAAIRKQQKDPHIFVMSGHTDYNLLKRLFKLQINGFIDKDNIDISDLVEVIKTERITKMKLKALTEKLDKAGAGLVALGLIASL